MAIPKKSVRAYAIVSQAGLHLDKVMPSPAEAWGLLADQIKDRDPRRHPDTTVRAMKGYGYRCVRVEISYRLPPE